MENSLWDDVEVIAEERKDEQFKENNRFIDDPTEGMKFISNILSINENSSSIEGLFQSFEKLIEEDFTNVTEKEDLPNEGEMYKKMQKVRNSVQELIEFPFIAGKNIVAFGGGFSAGKSAFINSIIGETILPTDTRPTTSIPTYIAKGEETKIYTLNNYGSKSEIDIEGVQAISHMFYEKYNMSFTHIIENIVLQSKSMEYEKIAFLDTPGYTKSDKLKKEDNTDETVARKHLANADYLLWVIDIEKGTIPQQDIEFISKLGFEKPIFFIFNKADKKIQSDIENILSVARNNLDNSGVKIEGICAYSAKENKFYAGDNFKEFLEKLNQSHSKVEIIDELDFIFDTYITHNSGALNNARTSLGVFNKLLVYTDEKDIEKKDLENIIKQTKKDIEFRKNIVQELEDLQIKTVKVAKEILINLQGINTLNISENDSTDYQDLLNVLNTVESTENYGLNYWASNVLNTVKSTEKYGLNYWGSREKYNLNGQSKEDFLINAVKENDIKKSKYILQKDVDINTRDKKGDTVLISAIKKNSIEIAKLLIEAGADVNAKSIIREESTFMIASECNATEIMNLLIKFGVDIHTTKDSDGRNSLMSAARENAVEALKLLIDSGIDIDDKDSTGGTALIQAAFVGATEVTKLLLEAGADIKIANNLNKTALQIAIEKNKQDIVTLLKNVKPAKEYNLNGQNKKEFLFNAIKEKDIAKVDYIIKNGANVNSKNDEDWTVLMEASCINSIEIIKLLIKAGADVNAYDESGWTALMEATNNKNIDILKVLIESGANVNFKADNGWTALINSSGKNFIEATKLLIKAGVDINAKDNNGLTALTNARTEEMVALLKKNGALDNEKYELNGQSKKEILFNAIREKDIDKVKYLIKNGANVNDKDNSGYTTLINASISNSTEIVKLLIESGADINAQTDNEKETALMSASVNNALDVARFLINSGAYVNDIKNNGGTALMLAAYRGHLDMVKLLIQSRADINTRNKWNETALSFAKERKHNEVINLLKSHGGVGEIVPL